jgi:intracellular sulfur oxidation DsrE/DsrF family protein
MANSRLSIRVPLIALGLALAAPLAIAVVATSPALADSYGEQKVVYHNSGAGPEDPTYFKRMLGNISNHIKAVGEDNLELVVVAHGDGLDMLQQAKTDPDLAGRIDTLKGKGVRFLVCANTLHSRNISLGDLYDAEDADVVPSGVAEIAHLEQQGFVYLHP